MKNKLGTLFKRIKAKCYNNHKYGFYIHAKSNACDLKTVVQYIVRYLGRPVIAKYHIDKYIQRKAPCFS